MKIKDVENFIEEEFYENERSREEAEEELGQSTVKMRIRLLAKNLQVLRNHLNRLTDNYKIIITSGYRTSLENHLALGANKSLHRTLQAVDIIIIRNQKIVRANPILTAEILGIISLTDFKGILAYEKSQGHYHLDTRKTPYFERK